MTDLGVDKGATEFHLVVRRPTDRSPLAPYRFTLSVLFSLLVGGNSLWNALPDGPGLDAAVARVLVAALFAWIVLGVINRAMKPAAAATTGIGAATTHERSESIADAA